MFVLLGDVLDWEIESKNRSFSVCNKILPECNITVRYPYDEKAKELTENGVDIFPNPMVIRFDDLTMKAQVFKCRPEKSNTLLGAISITKDEGYKFTSIFNDSAQILSFGYNGDTMAIIGNFNLRKNPNGTNGRPPHITITAVNEKTKTAKIYKYRYFLKTKTISSEIRVINLEKASRTKGEPGYIDTTDYIQRKLDNNLPVARLFYPSSPTHLILVEEGEYDLLVDTIESRRYWRAPKDYNIQTLSAGANLDQFISDGYTSCTYYINEEFEKSKQRGENRQKTRQYAEYNDRMKELIGKFDTVFVVFKNGYVMHLKVNGTVQ